MSSWNKIYCKSWWICMNTYWEETRQKCDSFLDWLTWRHLDASVEQGLSKSQGWVFLRLCIRSFLFIVIKYNIASYFPAFKCLLCNLLNISYFQKLEKRTNGKNLLAFHKIFIRRADKFVLVWPNPKFLWKLTTICVDKWPEMWWKN